MAKHLKWTDEQLLIAFALYLHIPFGKFDQSNPEIIRCAKLIGRTPGALAMKLSNIASLDPEITQSGRKGLSGSSAADERMWLEMQGNLEQFEIKACAALESLGASLSVSVSMPNSDVPLNFEGLTKDAVIKIRIGQQIFRKAVLSAYNSQCCISGLNISSLLVASHIKPWRVDQENRLNPSNGLCLSTLHDKAFDLGLITISKELKVHASKKLLKAKSPFLEKSLINYEGFRITSPERFLPDERFLRYHRENIFES
ncbi:MAG TPA: HNH endonuclease [Steroidobacteraceae bacterium]|nr:HNH endonuclease [Steroidobacteraceae bacterium]